MRVNERSSDPESDAVPHVDEQSGIRQKQRATDLSENGPSKLTRVCKDDESPMTQEVTESEVIHSQPLPEPGAPCEGSFGLTRAADSASAASKRRKDRPSLSPPPVVRRSRVANLMLPSTLRQNMAYGSPTGGRQPRAVECSRAGHPDSDYETVPESSAEESVDCSGLPVRLREEPEEHLMKDARESVAWWLSKCAFCVGKGFRGREVLHHMQECSRGGQD